MSATPEELWRLVDDLEAVSACIPGMSEFSSDGERCFTALMTQKVGPVTSRFRLKTTLTDLEQASSVVAVTEGKDSSLDSTVRASQRFSFRPADDATEVDIEADIRMTGRVATFGQRIILTKAEQVVIQSLANISDLLERRRADGADVDPGGGTTSS